MLLSNACEVRAWESVSGRVCVWKYGEPLSFVSRTNCLCIHATVTHAPRELTSVDDFFPATHVDVLPENELALGEHTHTVAHISTPHFDHHTHTHLDNGSSIRHLQRPAADLPTSLQRRGYRIRPVGGQAAALWYKSNSNYRDRNVQSIVKFSLDF